ncbi:phosphotyrosine protein phosphatase [Salmonella enterica]|nr:phosphotyrosine protein phosphatase [Salmonella enterica]
MNVLFICSRNQWRSPTAEQVFRRYPGLSVRSAGTSRNAKKSVSCGLLQWADVICVMEQKHKDRLMAEYRRIIENKPLHVLDIPDDYRYMDPELVRQLEELVPEVLGIQALPQGNVHHPSRLHSLNLR